MSEVKVKYGGLDRTKLQYSTGLNEIKIHPDWNPNNIDYDFCILKLNSTVQEGKNVKIISIADSTPPTGTQVHLTGWGKTFGILPYLPNHLQYISMKALSAPECNNKWKDVNQVTSRMLCATSKFGSGCNVSMLIFQTCIKITFVDRVTVEALWSPTLSWLEWFRGDHHSVHQTPLPSPLSMLIQFRSRSGSKRILIE